MAEPPELSDNEKARWKQVRTAILDFANAMLTGDEEGATAALNQAQHIDVDLTRILDSVHVPEDAGEFEEALTRILLRIPDGWGRWIRCSRGWYPLIVQLDEELAAIDPDYELHQVKEKYGGLRYYISESTDPDVAERMSALIEDAEDTSVRVCEGCGADGVLCVSKGGWYRTMCPGCQAGSDRGYRPVRDADG